MSDLNTSSQGILISVRPSHLGVVTGLGLLYTHLSVREYLFWSGSGDYCIQEEFAHAAIAITSRKLLASPKLDYMHFDQSFVLPHFG